MDKKKVWVQGWWRPFFPLRMRPNFMKAGPTDPVRINAQKVLKRLTDANWDVPGVEDWEWALEETIVEIFKDGTKEKEEDSQQ